MTTLWGDGWFYISALGLMVSCALFLYLLGQYRAAVEESESDEDMALPALSVIAPAGVRSAPPASAAPSVAPMVTPLVTPLAAPGLAPEERTATLPPLQSAARPAAVPAPAAVPPAAPEKRRSELTSSGGLSPAVAYLQNIKAQMEKFDKEIAALRSLAAQQSAQGETVLSRLAELAESVKLAGAQSVKLPQPSRSVELSLESPPDAEPVLAAAPQREEPPARAAEPPIVNLEPPRAESAAAPEPERAPAPEVVSLREVQEAADLPAVSVPPAPATATIPELVPAPAPVAAAAPEPAPPAPQPLEQPEEAPKARKGPVWPV